MSKPKQTQDTLFDQVYSGKCLNCWTNRGNYLGRWYIVARKSDFKDEERPVLISFNNVDEDTCNSRTTTEQHVSDMLEHAQNVDIIEFSELPMVIREHASIRHRKELSP